MGVCVCVRWCVCLAVCLCVGVRACMCTRACPRAHARGSTTYWRERANTPQHAARAHRNTCAPQHARTATRAQCTAAHRWSRGAPALGVLAAMHRDGVGTRADPEQMARCYRKAGEQVGR